MPLPSPPATATVVGGGPAGLIAAEVLAGAGLAVTVLDRMPSVGRKLLIAGHGGLNITHSEPLPGFVQRYGSAAPRIAPMLEAFSPEDLRAWCEDLGEPTFVGSSRRVFPQSFRANKLHRAWLARLAELGVEIRTRHRWTGWAEDAGPDGGDGVSRGGTATRARAVRATAADGVEHVLDSDVVVLALGGGSWPQLGSDGSWTDLLRKRGLAVTALRPANVGVRVPWTPLYAERFAGVPLKHLALTVRGAGAPAVPGDAMITAEGLEGGPVYAVGAAIRRALDADGRCVVELDLRPDLTVAELEARLRRRRPKDSTSSWLRRSVGLDPASVGLLREATAGAIPGDAGAVAALVKAVPVETRGTMPLAKAISSAGGLAWTEVDDALMLRTLPGTFVAGEMLDWEAPTGGYLLQASYSSGVVAARGALAWLGRRETPRGRVGE
ncbi:aminoacetone oxidase family FAD-binding enzyme [Serinibacter arcticus]|uniref:Aminoacetone oxidase family FAD-binding enzyme n=1 Tax=Serinibacter arcticus TaxID=1655435 RepID=A0A2U1ZRR4_9MICO|nr:TIGR03862 family flavoprotein [Serinibacter arcticus]PWD49612.1 aminoacetone oxidase family FAD-binding enzyme [Serinibacter arcticus]